MKKAQIGFFLAAFVLGFFASTIDVSAATLWEDAFDRADGPVGNGWTSTDGASGILVSGALRRGDEYGYRVYHNAASGTLPADYVVTMAVPQSTVDRAYWGLIGRYDPGTQTGIALFWGDGGRATMRVNHGDDHTSLPVTVTDGYPSSWSENQNHSVTLHFSGTTVTIYLDGSEYGYFTDGTNNMTGTSVGTVGEGANSFYDVLGFEVTDELGSEDDLTPPVLSSILVNPAETTAAVSWTTDESADSVVEYGLTDTYGSTASSASLTAAHSLALSGLTAGTTYHYRVSSTDASDNTATSDDATFTTDPEGSTPEEVVFHTTGATFSPILTVADGAVIEWTFHDGTTSSSASPTKNYGSTGNRENRLTVTPWSALTEVNIGYDGGDDGTLPNPHLVQQNVTAVDGMEYMAPYLRVWASSQNPVTSLDFSDFISLHTIECFLCQQMTSVNLSHTLSLVRANFEDNNLQSLDLSESPSLEDLRGANNGYTEIVWGDVGENVWHICTRDNPQLNVNFPVMSHFPLLEELWIWNDNQTGTFAPTSTVLRSVQAYDNHYTAADFSGLFPAGRAAEVNVNGNELTSLNISDNPGLMWLYARDNNLGRDAVDAVLHELATVAGGHNSGVLDLRGNTAPSATGFADVAILQARGWTVSVDASEDPIDILFLNTSAGTTTAAIYWNTSIDGTSLVEYGTDTGLGSSVSSDVMTSSHYILLEGLLPDTVYVFRAISEDAEGNGIGTENSVFRTRSTGTTYWEDDFHRADGSVGNEWASVNSAVGTIEDEALLRDDTGAYRVLYHMTDETLPSDYFVTMAVPYVTTGRNFWGLVGRYLPPGSGDGTGTQIFWSDQGRENPVPGDPAWDSALAVTVTGGIPDTWNENRIHTVTLGYTGSTVTAYLDGQEYGTFEKSTNNTTGTGVGIVGEGNGGTYGILDVRVTSFLPDFSDLSGDAAPEVTSFVFPETSDSLVVPISSFTATDDIGITGYLITESPDSPTYDDPMWSESIPTMFDFSTEGAKTLYAWVRDGSGSISSFLSGTVVVRTANPGDDDDTGDDGGEREEAPDDFEISDVKFGVVGADTVRISFLTSNETRATVRYGTESNRLHRKRTEDRKGKRHAVVLRGLVPGERYFFRISAEDDYDQEDRSRIHSLRLPSFPLQAPIPVPIVAPASGSAVGMAPVTAAGPSAPPESVSEAVRPEPSASGSGVGSDDDGPRPDIRQADTTVSVPVVSEPYPSGGSSFVWWNPFTWFRK